MTRPFYNNLSLAARRAATVFVVLSCLSGRRTFVPQRDCDSHTSSSSSSSTHSNSPLLDPKGEAASALPSVSSWFFGSGGGPLLVGATCPNLCSGHGECNIYSRCDCWDGYQGGDCSEYICPYGVAWSDIARADDLAHEGFHNGETGPECSNRGSCDRETGTCVCMEGWSGNACQRLSCTGDCNDHGACLSMRKLADRYTDEDSEQYEYDDVWDADKIYGCVCDYPYVG